MPSPPASAPTSSTPSSAMTSPQNVRRWLRGYSHGDRHMAPVFGAPRASSEIGETTRLSFLELAELVVAATIRRSTRVSLDKVRRAHEYAKQRWQIEYPF